MTLTATNGALTNGVVVKAVEDIVVSAASLENTATGVLESGGDISITAPTQTTNAGIVSAQGDLTIQTDILENDQGALLAVGKMILDGIGDSQATRVANRSGVIETLNGDITIDAVEFINERKDFSVSNQQTYSQWESTVVPVSSVVPGVSTQYLQYNASGTLYFTHPDDPEWHIYYDFGPLLVRQYTDVVTGTLPAAYLSSGGTLTVGADTIENKYSHISSAGDMTLTGSSLDNIGQVLTRRTTVYKSGGAFNRCASNQSCRWIESNGAAAVELSAVAYDSAEGTIQAGGQLSGSFTGQVDNLTILGSVSQGDLIQANTVLADTVEAPPLAELADVSLVDFFQQLPAKDALTQLAPASSKAVYETRVAFANPSIVLGSAYFLSRVNLDTNDIPDRFAFSQALEERLVQNVVRLKTGRRWLDPSVQDASLQLKQLIDSGIAAQEGLQLTVGVHLSRDQISRLNQSIIWYVEETINGERVLAPRLYLAATDAVAFSPNGASIVAASVELASTRIGNSGDITATDGAVQLTAEEDIAIRSGRVMASGDVWLRAGGALSVVTDTIEVRTANGGTQTLVGRKAWIEAGGSLTLEADESVVIQGADIRADEDVDIAAGDVLVVGSVAVDQRVNFGDGEAYDRWTQTTNRGSTIEAGGAVATVSGSDTVIQGSTVRAGGDIDVTAGGGVAMLSAQNVTDYEMQRAGGEKSGTVQTVDNIRTQVLAGGNVRITALTGDIITHAAKFQGQGRQTDPQGADDTGGTVTLNAEQGQVALLSVTDESAWTYQSSSSNVFFYKSRDAGAVDTTVIMTEIDAQGGLIIRAAPQGADESGAATGGVRVEIRDAGSLEANIAALAEMPGLEYLADLQARGDVDWQTVREIHDSWDYRAQGLTAAAAAVIALAATIATQGWGASLFFTQAAINAGGVMVAVANAGFSALAANASVSLINNRGDLGAVLKDLGSSQSLKSLATAMVTAGALNGLGFTGTTTEFADRLQQAAMRATVSATVSTVINGGELDDALIDGLTNAAIMTALASVQHEIGDFGFEHELPEGSIPKMIAHAMAGGLASELAGGEFADGAMAAALAELTGVLLGGTDLDEGTQVQLQRLIGATAVLLRGSDVDGVMFAGSVAASVHQYNYLTHEELLEAREAQDKLFHCRNALFAGCSDTEITTLKRQVNAFKEQSWSNTISMLNECEKGSAKCAGMLDAASEFVGEVASDRAVRSFGRGYPLRPGAEQFYVSAGDVMGLDTPVNIDALAVKYYGQAVEGDITYKQATEEFGAAALKHESGIKIFLGGVQIAGGLAALTACPITGGLTCATLIGLLAGANATLGINTVSEGIAQMLSGENERTLIENALIGIGYSEEQAAGFLANAESLVAIADVAAGGALILRGPWGITTVKVDNITPVSTVSVTRSVGADIPSTPVNNIGEFFNTLTGGVFKAASSRTSKVFQGQRVYKAENDIILQDGSKIRKGDQFYLDGLHKDHLEVFDSRGRPRIKVDLGGNNLGDIPSDRRLP